MFSWAFAAWGFVLGKSPRNRQMSLSWANFSMPFPCTFYVLPRIYITHGRLSLWPPLAKISASLCIFPEIPSLFQIRLVIFALSSLPLRVQSSFFINYSRWHPWSRFVVFIFKNILKIHKKKHKENTNIFFQLQNGRKQNTCGFVSFRLPLFVSLLSY